MFHVFIETTFCSFSYFIHVFYPCSILSPQHQELCWKHNTVVVVVVVLIMLFKVPDSLALFLSFFFCTSYWRGKGRGDVSYIDISSSLSPTAMV